MYACADYALLWVLLRLGVQEMTREILDFSRILAASTCFAVFNGKRLGALGERLADNVGLGMAASFMGGNGNNHPSSAHTALLQSARWTA
jgi:hypothetical protein